MIADVVSRGGERCRALACFLRVHRLNAAVRILRILRTHDPCAANFAHVDACRV